MDSLGAGPSSPGAREILHLVSTFQIKTDTKWIHQLARHFDRPDWRLTIACFFEGGPMQDRFEALGIRTYNLDCPAERDPRAVLRAKELIDRIRPDIVHTHLLRADLFGSMAARWAGVPVILSTVYGIGVFRRDKKRRSDQLLDLACAALPTHTLAVSHAAKRDCVERLGMDPSDITVIHTGVDPPGRIDVHRAAELRRNWQVGDDQSLILTVARLSREKGIDTLIDAAAILHRQRPHARVVVVGDGVDRTSLDARVRSRGLTGVVRLVGFLDDIWPALAAADVFCLPSRSEGMPNALLEAMAVGRPVVATSVGGIPEAIEDERNGLLVPPAKPHLLSAALTRLIDNKQDAVRFAEAARQTIEQKFLASAAAARYANLYDTLHMNRGTQRAYANS